MWFTLSHFKQGPPTATYGRDHNGRLVQHWGVSMPFLTLNSNGVGTGR